MLGWFSADPSYILNGQDVYMPCLHCLVQTHLISEIAKMSTCHAWMVYCWPILYLKWPKFLHVVIGWFTVLCRPILYLKRQICLHVVLGWFSADPSYILNGQDVYMPCLDGLVQTHLISEIAKMSTCHAWMVSADPSYILNGQDVYMSCLDGLVQTHLIS
jgi:hypothetical protein